MTGAAAILYTCLAMIVALFQSALAFGAPWGHLAMGGRYPGRLPRRMRIAAVFQGGLILLLAVIVLGYSGVIVPSPPGWLIWIPVAVTAISTVLNLITPSIPERRIWGPVTLVMLICVLRVALG